MTAEFRKDGSWRMPLQLWYSQWLKENRDTDLIYAKNGRGEASLRQLHFVRDELAAVLWSDVPYEKRQQEPGNEHHKLTGYVIGEHLSKSVKLPVYSLERPDLGIQFVLRENYYNWNVSVISERAIMTDLDGFHLRMSDGERKKWTGPGDCWGYCFFEGFPSNMKFGPWAHDGRRFSTHIGSDCGLYTFIWLIMRDLRRHGATS